MKHKNRMQLKQVTNMIPLNFYSFLSAKMENWDHFNSAILHCVGWSVSSLSVSNKKCISCIRSPAEGSKEPLNNDFDPELTQEASYGAHS